MTGMFDRPRVRVAIIAIFFTIKNLQRRYPAQNAARIHRDAMFDRDTRILFDLSKNAATNRSL